MQVDRSIYPYGSAQEHLDNGQTVEALQDWCSDNGPAILASCSQAEKLGISGTGDIRFYMNTPNTMADGATAIDTDGS